MPLPDNTRLEKYNAVKNPSIPKLNGDYDIQITFNSTYTLGIKPKQKGKNLLNILNMYYDLW